MVEDFYLTPTYWLGIISLMIVLRFAVRYRLGDFLFFILMYQVQFVVNALIVFGASDYLLFCSLFLLMFVLGYRSFVFSPRLRILADSERIALEEGLLRLCKMVVFVYYGWRIASFPFQFGAFDIAERLVARQENKLLYFLGLVITPLVTVCMYSWIKQRKLGVIDWVLVSMVVVGTLTTASKASIAPLILAYVGVSIYVRGKLRLSPVVVVGGIAAAAGVMAMLTIYFPLLTSGDILDLIIYRIAANTDSIEYLYVLGVTPDEYPFAGPAAMLPIVSKLFGANIEFPMGVWLHGLRNGDWSGFGPNSGIIMGYFGSFGWLGIFAGALFGSIVRWTLRVRNSIGAMVLSYCMVAVVEPEIFFMNVLFSAGMVSLAYILFVLPARAVERSSPAALSSPAAR